MTDDNVTWYTDETPPDRARGVLVWLGSMVFLVLGFWVMGTAIDQQNGVLFILGILSCAAALVLPVASQP
jgi:cytochrome c-type biogenesis protein CcmH/NrfF